MVSELPTARKPWLYLFSRLRSNRYITCVQCERATLPLLNHMPQTFSLLPVFRPVLSKGCWQGENNVALINVAINFCHEYFSFVMYFSKIFFVKTFFPTFFLLKLFFKMCFLKFYFQNFFPTSFQNLFFEGSTLDTLPFTETKRTLCICVMENMIYRPI